MQKWLRLVVAAGLCTPLLAAQAPRDPWPPPGVLTLQTPGIVPPVALERGVGRYTPEAMRAKIQGVVGLSCIVEVDGSVGDVRVVQSLDRVFGLDDQAILAAKRWKFRPATKDGVAARVVISISIGFSLRGEPPPSTWPALFPGATDAAINEADWDETKGGAAGVVFRVPHPKSWTVAGTKNNLIAIKSPSSLQFIQVSEPRPLPKPIPLPLPVGQLQQATQSLAALIGLHDFRAIGGGQAWANGRWWLWQDQVMPVSAVSRLPQELRDALSAELEGMRLWLFLTSVGDDAVMVFCTALLPRGLSEADMDRELRPTAAIFDRMIKKMVFAKAGTSERVNW